MNLSYSWHYILPFSYQLVTFSTTTFCVSNCFSTFLLLLGIAIAALIFDKSLTNNENELKDSKYGLYFRLLLIALLFQWLAVYQANCFRIAMYFSIFPVMTIIPNTLYKQKDFGVKTIGTIVVILLLLVQLFCITYHTSGVNPYEFFWEIL